MCSSDLERFLAEAPSVLPDGYQIDNTRTRPEYPFMFTKLGLKGTLLIPDFGKGSAYRMPISLDILPLDNMPDDVRAFRKVSRKTWLWGRLLYLQGTPTPYLIGITGAKRMAIHSHRRDPRGTAPHAGHPALPPGALGEGRALLRARHHQADDRLLHAGPGELGRHHG